MSNHDCIKADEEAEGTAMRFSKAEILRLTKLDLLFLSKIITE